MNQTIYIYDVVEVESIDKTLTDADNRPIPLTEITITTDDGSTITINLFDAKEVPNVVH